MKVHEKYIALELFGATCLVLCALTALYSFFDLIERLKDVGKGSFAVRHAFAYIALSLPARVYELMPIAVLIGTLYALSSLARHSEITVFRTSGMSTGQLLLQLFRVASFFALLTLILGEAVVPYTERFAQNMRIQAIHSVIATEFVSGLWVKDNRAFINIRAATPDSRLENILVYQFDEQNRLEYVMKARQGGYLKPGLWQLDEVTRTFIGETGKGPRTWVKKEGYLEWASSLTPDIISMLMVSPERMSLISLVTYLKHLWNNQQKTDRYEIALWKKLFHPLAALVMAALALPFGYIYRRMGGVSLQIFGGVMTGVLFHMLNGLFSSLGIIRAWPPFLTAITPPALFLIAAMGILWKVERR